jgi:outer membrane protein TolC
MYAFMKRMLSHFALLAMASACLRAQLPGGAPSASSRVTQVGSPVTLGGSQVTAQQNTQDSGAATINGSIQVSGQYAGSVAESGAPAGPITLTLADAIKRGLSANLGPIAATDSARAARAKRLQSLSALLPNISASVSDSVQQVNLAAYGFQFHFPTSLGFSIPSVVGPFNYSSATAALNQSLFDMVQRRNWQGSKETERASVLAAKDARELVVLAVGGTYLQTIATAARVASQKAQVANAQAIYNQAEIRKAAGTNARIDVTRTFVELQTEQQRLLSLQADFDKQTIALARLIGLPQGRELVLGESLLFKTGETPEAGEAIQRALAHRADLQAAGAQVQAAKFAVSAAQAERLPSASLSGDYGVTGPNPSTVHGVFAVTAAVNVPIWQGGRVSGDIQEAQANLHQRQAEFDDQKGRVEQDVRDALIELQTASGQVRLAESNKTYAAETLTQSRDRFAAGVATTVEVVQAQEQVASAESDYISSIFAYNLAKFSLARATGELESTFADIAKGEKSK